MTATTNKGYIPTIDFLAWAIRQARIDGALVTGHAAPPETQTWRRAIAAYDAHRADLSPEGNPSVYGPTLHEETAEARDLLAYFRAQAPEEIQTDYLMDLYVLLADDELRRDRLALATSAILIYRRALERQARAEAEARLRQTSRHAGAVGGTIADRVIVERYTRSTDRRHIYTLRGAAGNAYVVFSAAPDFKLGWEYTLRARVTGHTTYKGEARTIVVPEAHAVAAEGSHPGPARGEDT